MTASLSSSKSRTKSAVAASTASHSSFSSCRPRVLALAALTAALAGCGAEAPESAIDEAADLGEVGQALVSQAKIDAADQIIDDFIANLQAEPGRTPAVCIGYTASGSQFRRVCAGQTRTDSTSDILWPPATTYANDETIFRIGSLSKLFTGSLLAARKLDAAALSGGCSNASAMCYDEKLVDHIGANMASCTVDCAAKNAVTLKNLANHQSGLPKNALLYPLVQYTDPLLEADYVAIALGTPTYSNFGFALLAHALEDNSTQGYRQQVQSRLLGPLGMVDTMVDPSSADIPRLAQSPGNNPGATDAWGPAFDGSGGYHSTLDDLMEFLRWHESYISVPSVDAIRTETVDNKLGWGVEKQWPNGASTDPTLVSKNGASTGFESYIGFLKGTGKGVVVLFAYPDDDPTTVGEAVLDALR